MSDRMQSDRAGPSRSARPPPKLVKSIARTTDLIQSNSTPSGKGKGKERAVLGDLTETVKGLPPMLQVEKFAEIRALEILAFQNAVKSAASQGASRVFQSLPRHLRRRAASHNPRRVPRKLRARAAAEIDEGDQVVKRQRKRARLRAMGNLKGETRTEQMLKRQRDKAWLATHVWHAKRFHMVNLWGYRLPLTPTLKSFRPSYRASKRKAIFSDVSYMGTIELQGGRDVLLSMLGRMTGGQRFAGPKYESGGRASEISLYGLDQYPRNFIGPAQLLWQRPVPDGSLSRTMWVRLHPSIFQQAWDTFKHYFASAGEEILMRDLRLELEAFEVMGPLAGKAIQRIFDQCRTDKGVKIQFFNRLSSMGNGAEPGHGLVAGIKVHDPRLKFPPVFIAQDPAAAADDGTEPLLRSDATIQPGADLAMSDLWNSELRSAMSRKAYKKSDLDHRRQEASRLGIPGTRLHPTASDDRLPVLIIQSSRSSSTSPSQAIHGFTLLFPPSWSMPILSSLVYSGCLVGGLRERRVQHHEAGVPSFPEHYGRTCLAGAAWELRQAAEAKESWTRKPPGKRVEWSSVGTSSPWVPDWDRVMLRTHLSLDGTVEVDEEDEEAALNGWGQPAEADPWLVESPILDHLDTLIVADEPAATLLRIVSAFRRQRGMSTLSSAKQNTLYNEGLLHIRLDMLGRGSPGDMAVIYALDSAERRHWLNATSHESDVGASIIPIDARETQSLEHQLGEVLPDVRTVIGYTTSGNYSLARGRGHAMGSISLAGYVAARRVALAGPGDATHQVLVKVKNRDGRLCRLAAVELV